LIKVQILIFLAGIFIVLEPSELIENCILSHEHKFDLKNGASYVMSNVTIQYVMLYDVMWYNISSCNVMWCHMI